MFNKCEVCGNHNCRRLAHVDVNDFPYEGTREEFNAVEQEINDVRTQIAELKRQERLLIRHRQHIYVIMTGHRFPSG